MNERGVILIDVSCVEMPFGLKNLFENIKFKRKFSEDNPTYFEPDGLCLFVGPQGSGKTLSAVQYVKKLLLKYPKTKLCTNINIKDYSIVTFKDYVLENYNKITWEKLCELPEKTQQALYKQYLYMNRVFAFDNQDDLINLSNLDEGVIFLIDEIHLYFNSLESKNINIDVMNQIAQQRKQRKHIVGTTQVFGRLSKPFREQFNVVIQCKCYFKLLQCNVALNQDNSKLSEDGMHLEGDVIMKTWFFHSPVYYSDYDTSYIIDRNKFISEEEKKGDIYERDNTTIIAEKH